MLKRPLLAAAMAASTLIVSGAIAAPIANAAFGGTTASPVAVTPDPTDIPYEEDND
ncbi:hypothetical protein [Nonomuraea lactucae]|uniref:hypothetical protein n=1 Tax=Nonomuraea lactucae TaxID=2249762 RepID=UPI0013B408FF|nr:hypothetical protein [Nonomuraea lactucae]